MKAMIGYGVYRKPDMIGWYLEGIREHFPKDSHVAFHFEAEDGVDRKQFEQLVKDGMLDGGYVVHPATGTREHLLEHGVHRHLIDRFMDTDCDVLIVPHDDNRFQRPLLPDLERLCTQYGTTLGWISGRDGYSPGYADMVCSPFSQSIGAEKEFLPIGHHREVMMMNTGPVVYFRHVIHKVGMPDPDMPWYWWDDYALRCHTAGLKNVLLSMDCLHEKFGRLSDNPALGDGNLVADCLKELQERWRPILGRDPL